MENYDHHFEPPTVHEVPHLLVGEDATPQDILPLGTRKLLVVMWLLGYEQ